jgi:hypothetical protein
MEEMYIFLSKAKDTQRILKRCGFAGCTGSGLLSQLLGGRDQEDHSLWPAQAKS